MRVFLERISEVYKKLMKELKYKLKSKVNNKLLVNKKMYTVCLDPAKPFICIVTDKISVKYNLYLEDHIGLDMDGDIISIIFDNEIPLAVNYISGGLSRICVGKEIK